MLSAIVNNAIKISLGVQAITGAIGLYGLTIPIASNSAILHKILGLELIVQFIEFAYYVTFLFVPNLTDLTRKRYYDWFFSTPIMLFAISLYFFYNNFIENKENKTITITNFIKNNVFEITGITVLNFLMLLFGFLSELGMMDRSLAFILGTGALSGSFGIIYKKFAKFSKRTKNIFWIIFIIWALYGIAFLLSPINKNISYTILDIFAKNFFGVFLVYIILQKRI
jgi:bacteriorhodopsin